MVEYYKILGLRVGSHVLSGLTLGTFFGGVWYLSRSPSKPAATNEPPINAKSKAEEAFVKEFLAKQESGKAKQ